MEYSILLQRESYFVLVKTSFVGLKSCCMQKLHLIFLVRFQKLDEVMLVLQGDTAL